MAKQRIRPYYDGTSVVHKGVEMGIRYEFDKEGVHVIMWGFPGGYRHVTVENAYGWDDYIGVDDDYQDNCSCCDKLVRSYVPHKYVSRDFYESLCCKIMAGDMFPEPMRKA